MTFGYPARSKNPVLSFELDDRAPNERIVFVPGVCIDGPLQGTRHAPQKGIVANPCTILTMDKSMG
jgi:hypothetical protein